jgi:hypothetical protein
MKDDVSDMCHVLETGLYKNSYYAKSCLRHKVWNLVATILSDPQRKLCSSGHTISIKKQNESNQKSRRDDMSVEKKRKQNESKTKAIKNPEGMTCRYLRNPVKIFHDIVY